MPIGNSGIAGVPLQEDEKPELREVVMGLHWAPLEDYAKVHPENLDALCVLFDREQQIVEIIHPGNPRSSNGSVVHTGDSRTGASQWDDERIFVFLEALPADVTTLVFIVASVTGKPIREVRGASCHISDHATEYQWVNMELTTLDTQTTCCVATLSRSLTGWEISPTAQDINRENQAQSAALAALRQFEFARSHELIRAMGIKSE
ncbi:MAG: TerD family protein [Burkholderiales bacterium]|nr:TerD family protein [Burkholderiales bacterium]